MKQACRVCKVFFQYTCEFFYKNKSNKSGLSKICKDCGRKKRSDYYRKNSEIIKQKARERNKLPHIKEYNRKKNREWFLANKEKAKAYAKEYYKIYNQRPKVKEAQRKAALKHRNANKEKINKAHAERTKKNPEKHREKQARRRARLVWAGIEKFSVQQVLDKSNNKCGYCGINLTINSMHMDHMVPVCRGGSHTLSNMIASCPPCNLRKNKRTYDEFMAIISASRVSSDPVAAAEN